MTKFYLASDLHLEFGALTIENTDKVDCLILAGDVAEFDQLKPDGETRIPHIADTLRQFSRDFARVIWVPGNHEYYGCQSMSASVQAARDWLKIMYLDNIEILDNDTTHVNGIPVHGTTLWTDYDRGSPTVRFNAEQNMNDFEYIRGADPDMRGKRLSTLQVMELHKQSLKFLDQATADGTDCIVVSHHQPTLAGLSEYTHGDLDYAYASDLSEFFMDRPCIKYWCSGHVHVAERRLVIGPHNQEFLTNCRGYLGHEPKAAYFKPWLFEL